MRHIDGPNAQQDEHFILFTRLPLIYGRVPKVANSSIKAALSRLLNEPPEEGYRTTADSFWRKGTHGETCMITSTAAVERRSSHFSFSFVRNPFDRLVSAYNNKIVENDHLSSAMQRMGLRLGMSFCGFLEILADTAEEELDVHLLPQSSMLCASGIPIPGFVGKMEAMAEHWKLLRRRMQQAGLPALGKLPNKNVRRSGDDNLSSYFQNDLLIERAWRRYRNDVELFYSEQDIDQMARGRLSGPVLPLERSVGPITV
jgi:dermatan 4-sulfotransferase 1